jgi:predicted ATP-grasp superfamily ATP-dependent carboligase
MPMPATSLVQSEHEVQAFAAQARFPCLLKPLHFREWQVFPDGHPLSFQKVAIAQTPEQLLAAWRLAAAANPRTIAQEIIEGPDTDKRVYVACYDHAGRRTGHALFRELRCDPMDFGPASVSEPVADPDTDAVCDHFLRSIGYSGICEIEMKRDTRDGQIKLIEANPRLTGGGDAAPYAGVDVCWLHYLDLIGQPVSPVGPDGRDFRHIVLRADVRAVLAYRRAGRLSWRDVIHSYRGPRAYYDFDRLDWRYSLGTLRVMIRSAIGFLVRRIFRARGAA